MSCQVITESTSDLSPNLIKRFNLRVVPLYVRFGNETVMDDVGFDQEAFLQKLRQCPEPPTTSRVTAEDFARVFRECHGAGAQAIYVGVGSQISDSFKSATEAARQIECPPLALIDSNNLSMGVGLLACRTAELLAEGMDPNRVVSTIQAMIPRVRTAFIVSSLEFLHKGGRLTATQAFLGTLMNVHPCISIVEGRLTVAEQVRGNRAKALEYLLERTTDNADRMDPWRIAVTHVGCENDAVYLMERLRELTRAREIVITRAGSAVSSHCGPGAIGVLYIEK